jgi:hypothetical protein
MKQQSSRTASAVKIEEVARDLPSRQAHRILEGQCKGYVDALSPQPVRSQFYVEPRVSAAAKAISHH